MKLALEEKVIIIGTLILVAISLPLATIKDINRTEYGVQINFKNNTGYWIEKEVK